MEVTSAILFLLERYSIVVNFSRQLMLTRNGSLLMNMMTVHTSSSLRKSRISLGISMKYITRLSCLRLNDLLFNEVISGPKISLVFFTLSKIIGQLTIMFEHNIFSKSRPDGTPSSCIACHASRGPLYSLCMNLPGSPTPC